MEKWSWWKNLSHPSSQTTDRSEAIVGHLLTQQGDDSRADVVQELRVPQRKGLEHFAWHVESLHVKPLASVRRVHECSVPSFKKERNIPVIMDLPFGP